MRVRRFDLCVVGGGSGGVRAARVAAHHGANVVLVEGHRLGGTCVTRGCVPKKLMVYASRFPSEFADALGYGWGLDMPTFSWAGMKVNRDREVARLESLYQANLERAGVTLVHDFASFETPTTIRLHSGESIDADCVLLATGAQAHMGPSIVGHELAEQSDDVFEWETLPKRVLVQGSGYIAVEFACMLAALGARITLVFRAEEPLRGFDIDLRQRLRIALIRDGIEVLAGRTVSSITVVKGARIVTLSDGTVREAEKVLFATGRIPNVRLLGLDRAGVQTDDRGAVLVDAMSQTNVGHIHAVGDVTNRVNLTPAAIREAQAYSDTYFGGKPTPVHYANIPTAVFTSPELASVGLTEEQALESCSRIDIYRTEFRPMKASMAARDENVFMKLIVNRDDDRVLGCHMLGSDAGEMIQLLGVALQAGARKIDFDTTLAVHPTVAEEWVTMKTPASRHGA